MFNLLEEETIRVTTAEKTLRRVSLPTVFELSMKDEVLSFPGLRPHQRHAWHAFLAQLGAIALVRSGSTNIPVDGNAWRDLLRNLTPEFPGDAPWNLVVNDFQEPAFLQPPSQTECGEKKFKKKSATPDLLDILVTAKNHDLKSSTAYNCNLDDWLFSLITLQTMGGFDGSGNYGIARMNGGYGSRPAFSMTPSDSPGVHLKRDIPALLETRSRQLTDFPFDDKGISMVWLVPWDGTKDEMLGIRELDPYFIEVCRRVRLKINVSGAMECLRATSKAPRVDAKEFNGNIGDPWIPIELKDSKSLTLASGGFHYRKVSELLFSSNWKHSPLLRPRSAERNNAMFLLARGMVRGQGKSEGYYERIIPLRNRTTNAFGRPGGTQQLGDIVENHIREIGTIQRILRRAISVYAAGGNDSGVSDEHRNRARPWSDRLDHFVDRGFFERLQDEFEADDLEQGELIRKRWMLEIVDAAWGLLLDAEESLPCPTIQRYRARVSAEGLFQGSLRGSRGLPAYFAGTESQNGEKSIEE